jgi:hypothetical protein
MSLPRPGAPRMDNLIATILQQDNRREWLNLDRIAEHQKFDPDEFRARFAKIETAFSLTPRNCEVPDGK